MPNYDSRLGCSTISFRHQPLAEALATIAGLGFSEIDLGALPGVCDHVPYVLDVAAVEDVARTVIALRSAGALDQRRHRRPQRSADRRTPAPRGRRHLDMLVALAVATDARALVLPCGALDHTPVDTLDADIARVAGELVAAADVAAARGVESVDGIAAPPPAVLEPRTRPTAHRPPARQVGVVMDFSHVVASGGDPVEFVDRFGPRIEHVHIRDAVPGNINLSVGRGARRLRPRAEGTRRRRLRRPLLTRTRDPRRHQRPTTRRDRRAARLISDLI